MIEILRQFHFIRPYWLILVPVAVAVWWIWQKSVDPLRGWRKQIAPELLKALIVNESSEKDRFSHVVLAGWMIAVVAIAGPTWQLEANPFAEDAQPLLILLKADDSMLVQIEGTSFLQRAQLKIQDLAKAREGDPLGLIVYAGSAHIVLPPTEDTSVVASMAAEVSPEIMPTPGDQLDLALKTAGRLLKSQNRGGSIVVMADRVDLSPSVIESVYQSIGKTPIQFLELAPEDSPEANSIQSIAKAVHGKVQHLSINDSDIKAITEFAERRSATGVGGESERWQEAGYWLSPILACVVALSFRRRQTVLEDTSR